MLRKAFYILTIAVLIYMLKKYMNGCEYNKDTRIDGKIVIVTGANTGIGKVTAQDLVTRGATVYMACRSLERGHAALEDIKNVTGAKDENLILLPLDLSSLVSIRQFVAEFKKREKRLDILVNNAGVMWPPYSKTKDGFEMTFGVNHLGHFLLTNLLVDMLVSSAPSRVVTVSSYGHVAGSIVFDDLMPEKNYGRMFSYSQSKLANILFANELGRRLQGAGVTSVSLHPGSIVTELGRHMWFYDYPIIRDSLLLVLSPLFKDVWHGAQTTLFCALDESVATSVYYSDCVATEPIAEAKDLDVAKRLWQVSAELVNLQQGETHPLVR